MKAADFNTRCAPSIQAVPARMGSVHLRRSALAGRSAGRGAFCPSALTRGDTLFVLVSQETQERRGGAERRLTSGPNVDQAPAWSPDGRRIAFVAQRLDSNVTDIWIVNARGGTPTPLTHSSDSNRSPAWSPDGSEILYVKDEFFGHDTDLYAIRVNGGPLVETLEVAADWPQDAPSWQRSRR